MEKEHICVYDGITHTVYELLRGSFDRKPLVFILKTLERAKRGRYIVFLASLEIWNSPRREVHVFITFYYSFIPIFSDCKTNKTYYYIFSLMYNVNIWFSLKS